MQNFRILSEGGKCPAKLSPKRTQHYVSIVLVLLKRNFLFFFITSIQPIHMFSEAAGSRYDLELCYTEDITGDDTESILLKMHCCIIS